MAAIPGFGNLAVEVGRPWWLILIPLVLPPLVWAGLKSLSGLGKVRRWGAIGLRAAVVCLIVLALAEVRAARRADRLTTIFLIDASQSVPQELKRAALDYVAESSKKRRPEDLSGVIVFGKTPRVETPPGPTELNLLGVESTIDPENTDVAAALKLALATFPEDTARRIVVLSDGNENRGNLMEQAAAARSLGVQVDVVPIEYVYDHEVLVEKLAVPPDVKQGETIDVNVVIRAGEPTRGAIQVFQKTDDRTAPAAGNEKPFPVELQRGVNVFTLKQKITKPNFYTFSAEFIPERSAAARSRSGASVDRAANNTATGFTHARGRARILLIEGTGGEHAELVKALREKEIEVNVLLAPRIDGSGGVGGDPLPIDPAQLQPYDAVVLANVPKEAFTESQHQLLASNVHDMGIGLLMVGGRDGFGAGGWMNTPVEKALPVDMQIKAVKVQGIGAMVLIMHASEIPEGNHWQKVVAKAAIDALSSYDHAGMLHWDGQEAWLFTIRPIGGGRNSMLRAIDRMTPGDMPDFDPSLLMSLNGLNQVQDAMSKHIVVISDGDPTPPTSAVIKRLVESKVTVTAVLTAAHGNDPQSTRTMRDLARLTKGRFYNVTNPQSLPQIYQKEARSISRPLIFEQETPWRPKLNPPVTEPILGLPDEFPPVNGLVLTSLKENELVEAPLTSPLPTGQVNPLLAHWTYGLGRSAAFTSDAGRRWAKTWPDWTGYTAFWSQVVRWVMRPADRGDLSLSLRREDGRIKIVVDALDKESRFLNFLSIQGNVVDPDLKSTPIELVQKAPGRYEAAVEGAEARGNYFVNLGYRGADGVRGVVSSGISVPYSDEYRETRSNPAVLETLASLTGGRAAVWKRTPDGRLDLARSVEDSDHYRRDAGLVAPRTLAPLWPQLLWAACCLFLLDAAVRRIAPDLHRMRRAAADRWRAFRGREPASVGEYMEKLRSRKAEVAEELDRSKSRIRSPESPSPEPRRETRPGSAVAEPLSSEREPKEREPKEAAPGAAEPPGRKGLAPDAEPSQAESYADRLLRAKQRVWEERDRGKDEPKPES